MKERYKEAILLELGTKIAKELIKNKCEFVVNTDNLTFSFLNCPADLLEQVLEMKILKGEHSILDEFILPGKWSAAEQERVEARRNDR